MPITTVPAKTSISRRTIQLKPITGSRRMATISLHHSRTIPTRTHRSSPCRDMPRVRRATTSPAYVWQWSVGCLRFVRPRIWLGRSRLRAADSACATCTAHLRPADVRTYGLRTIGADPLLSGADSAPIHAVRIQSATNLRAADLLSGDPTAARLWLRAEVEDRRRPARPVPRHPRRAQLLSGIHRQGRGSAVADPDRMDHPHRTDHFRNLGSDRSRPHPVLQLRVQLAPRWARPRTPRLMGRGLYKQPGGKLVGVSVQLSDDIPAYFRECASSIQSVEQCRIDGDFFLTAMTRIPADYCRIGKTCCKASEAHPHATLRDDCKRLPRTIRTCDWWV